MINGRGAPHEAVPWAEAGGHADRSFLKPTSAVAASFIAHTQQLKRVGAGNAGLAAVFTI
jgi:hypothetical protein